MKEEDIQLINRIKTGDEDSFKQLFETWYALLVAFANKYVLNLELARDIVQELFVHLYENRRNLIITASLKSYLFQSVQNRCLNHLKSHQLHEAHHKKLTESMDHSIHLEDQVLETEMEHVIFQNVNKLPDQCKRIFLLSRMEGKRNMEIAEELRISKRTVETQISKALKILREALKHYMNM